jgi:hypothetical protein
VTLYSDCEIYTELWRQKNWLLHLDNEPSHTSIFHQAFFNKNNMTLFSQPLYFSVSPIGDKTKGCQLDTIWFTEAESQAMPSSI